MKGQGPGLAVESGAAGADRGMVSRNRAGRVGAGVKQSRPVDCCKAI